MPAAKLIVATLVTFGLALGCGRENVELVGDGGGAIPGLRSIEVSPPQTTVVIGDLNVKRNVAFVAMGSFASGDSRDITNEVSWGVDNVAPGTFVAAGDWESSNAAGGAVVVEARAGLVADTANLTVVINPSIYDPDFPPPANVEDLFDANTPVVVGDPNGSPLIVYPAHEVMFPTNLYRVLFQYNQGAGTDVYRIRFVSDFLDMQVFTTSDRWQANQATWTFLATTNAGGKVVMTVTGVDSQNPTTLYQSHAIDVLFSESAVEGAIYYWSTSSGGVMKGVVSSPTPTKFYTQDPDSTCVACHTLSRDGSKLAVGYGGEKLQEVDVPGRNVLISESRNYAVGWSTYSPDGSLLLISSTGVLTLLDSANGDPVGANAGVVDLGPAEAAHPDWSPLGNYVAMAVCGNTGNKSVNDCGIGRVPYNAGAWGALEILVPASGDNNFFPKYSADGQWIAYVNAVGASKDQATSQLRLIPAAGGSPIDLVRGNQRVGPDDGLIDMGNSMPTWAPSTHPGTQWIAFSSLRDYGKVRPGGGNDDQLWAVAVDLRVAMTQDPSFAAFWLPLQDVLESNHRAFWTHDVDIPCPGTVEVCDGFDNDCDGVIDEDCIPCVPDEVCFDGIDNNCDGQVDEGCIE